jgi:hypothetical protein
LELKGGNKTAGERQTQCQDKSEDIEDAEKEILFCMVRKMNGHEQNDMQTDMQTNKR